MSDGGFGDGSCPTGVSQAGILSFELQAITNSRFTFDD